MTGRREYGIAVKGRRVQYAIDRRSVSLGEFETAIRRDVRRSTMPENETEALDIAREIAGNLRAQNYGRVTFHINLNPVPWTGPEQTCAPGYAPTGDAS